MGAYGIPLPPEVTSQMPAMGQFAGGGGPQQPPPGMSDPGAPQQGMDGTAFANEALNTIAEILGKVAMVLAQTRPELGPIMKKMAEAGSLLQSQLQGQGAQQAQSGGGIPSPKPQGPQDVPMA